VAAKIDIYGGVKPWEVPAYTLPTAARHVRVPAATLRYWVFGRTCLSAGKVCHALPLIDIPKQKPRFLSFLHLVEAHVLASMRRKHELPMHKVRKALAFVEKELKVKHPLATEDFRTDGVDLFVERVGKVINVSSHGQMEIKAALDVGLRRIRYEGGLARRLFPFVRSGDESEQPMLIEIDPRMAFGRPVLTGTGIRVEDVAERFQAGESAAALARDFDVDLVMIEEAVRAVPRAAA
jgi:uncharacterized protein (DUF433 family)